MAAPPSALKDGPLPWVDLHIAGDGSSVKSLINKTWHGWKYVYERHVDDFDWFIKADDDTFLYMHNFRAYVAGLDPGAPPMPPPATIPDAHRQKFVAQQARFTRDARSGLGPRFLGRRFANVDFSKPPTAKCYYPCFPTTDVHQFNAGGASMALNAPALRRLGCSMKSCEPGVRRYDVSRKKGNHEDIVMSRALQQVGIFPWDTRDAHGAERFHVFDPKRVIAKDSKTWGWCVFFF